MNKSKPTNAGSTHVSAAARSTQIRNFYAFLARAQALISTRAQDIQQLYQDICHLAIELDQRLVLAWVGGIQDNTPEVQVLACAGDALGYLEDLRITWGTADAHGQGPTGRSLQEGVCIVANHFMSDPSTRPWQQRAGQYGIASTAAIPLRRNNRVCGSLVLYANEEDVFDEDILEELDILGKTLSFAIDAEDARVQRQALDAQLQESRQTLRAILDAANQTILMMSPDGTVLAINRMGAERLGMSPQEMVGRNLYEMLPPDLAERRRQQFAQALESGCAVESEDEQNGRFFRTTIYPSLDDVSQVALYAEEITDRVKAEQTAATARQRFEEVVNLATEGILTLDLEGAVTFANPRLHTLLGMAPESLVGRSVVDFIVPENRQDFLARMAERRRNQPLTALVTYQLLPVNGAPFPVLISSTPMINEEGQHYGLVVVVTDITELHKVQAELADNKQRLEIALASAAESIWELNLDTGQAYWSSDFYRQLGYQDQEFPGSLPQWLEHMPADEGAATLQAMHRQLESGNGTVELTFRFRAKAGEYRWIRARGRVIQQGEGGRPVLLTGTNADVTEQYVEERRRRLQSERWLALLQLAQMGEYKGREEERVFLTRALADALRLTSSAQGYLYFVRPQEGDFELLSCGGQAGPLPEGPPVRVALADSCCWGQSLAEGRALIFNDPACPHSCQSSVSRLITVPVIEEQRVTAVAWVGGKNEPYDQDDLEFLQVLATEVWRIVQRRRVEVALREALQVVEASPVVFFRWRAAPGWPVEFVSQNVSRWGYAAADLESNRLQYSELIHPDDLQRVVEEVERNSAGGLSEYVQEYRLKAADGHYFWVEDSTRVIRDETGKILRYEGVMTDVNAEKERQRVLAESLEVQRALNHKLENAQNQLLQSEKMASIGQLAAGVAHELNNPIGFISSNLGTLNNYLRDLFEIFRVCDEVAERSGHPEEFAPIQAIKQTKDFEYLKEDIAQLLSESNEGIDRVRKIVQDLKDFSRVGETNWQWADVHRGLDSTLNIVWNELKYKCKVTKDYASLPQIYCLPSQLNQVFMNLLVNAAQAIDQQGDILIRTFQPDQAHVAIAVSDTGSGIPAENLSRLFDPFFTTKPVGKGTGLGLSLSWSIVARHQGHIAVESEVGKGTTFTVTLPIEPANLESAEKQP